MVLGNLGVDGSQLFSTSIPACALELHVCIDHAMRGSLVNPLMLSDVVPSPNKVEFCQSAYAHHISRTEHAVENGGDIEIEEQYQGIPL